jgi:hypothetical protein
MSEFFVQVFLVGVIPISYGLFLIRCLLTLYADAIGLAKCAYVSQVI